MYRACKPRGSLAVHKCKSTVLGWVSYWPSPLQFVMVGFNFKVCLHLPIERTQLKRWSRSKRIVLYHGHHLGIRISWPVGLVIIFGPLVFPGALWYAPRIKLWLRYVCSWYHDRYLGRNKWITYMTPRLERKYWLSAASYGKQLDGSNVQCRERSRCPTHTKIPLVTYYAPRLPPSYRITKRANIDARGYYLSSKNFCKWHWMVFPGSVRVW